MFDVQIIRIAVFDFEEYVNRRWLSTLHKNSAILSERKHLVSAFINAIYASAFHKIDLHRHNVSMG